jgi:adenylate cyclase
VDEKDLARVSETALALLPGAVRAMDVILRRHMEQKTRPFEELLHPERADVDMVDRAVGFCDLVGYTSLAEREEPEELARLLRRFEATAADLITARGGSVVKLIGDEIMFVAPDAATGAYVSLGLAEVFDDPPVRCGLASGRLIVREGDYHGPVVNLAARLVKIAPPGGVMTTRALAGDLEGFGWVDAGPHELKGFDEPVDVARIER